MESTGKVFVPLPGRNPEDSTTLSMSRAFGDFYFKQNTSLFPEQQAVCAVPSITTLNRSKDDAFIVLASDGVWDVMTSQGVLDFVYTRLCSLYRDSTSNYELNLLPSIADELIQRCVETLGSVDNMSCIIVLLNTPDALYLQSM